MHVGDANGSCKNCHFHLSNKSSEWVNKHVISWEMSFHDRGHWQSFCMSESSLELANFCTFQFEHVKFAICACCLFRNTKTSLACDFWSKPCKAHLAATGRLGNVRNARHPAGRGPGGQDVSIIENPCRFLRFARDISSVIYTNFSSISNTSCPSLPK